MRGQPASFPMSPENDKFEIFVHGTDHKSAKNIIEEGIRLSEGEDAQDFSDGEGFYLGNNFDEALEWAGHKHMDGEAVLIYEVDMEHLRGDNNENGLDLSNNKRKWLQVVSEYRLSGLGRNEKPPSKALRKELEQYNFIEGPMASVSKKNPRPRQKDGNYQLCIRNTACAALFDRCLSYVIFFERWGRWMIALMQFTDKLKIPASLLVAFIYCWKEKKNNTAAHFAMDKLLNEPISWRLKSTNLALFSWKFLEQNLLLYGISADICN